MLPFMVVSRAHRMGARSAVYVELLAMKGSMEEAMLNMATDDTLATNDVVSRAHRMGARSAVYVELLAMKGSIEEEMLNMATDDTLATKDMAATVYASVASGTGEDAAPPEAGDPTPTLSHQREDAAPPEAGGYTPTPTPTPTLPHLREGAAPQEAGDPTTIPTANSTPTPTANPTHIREVDRAPHVREEAGRAYVPTGASKVDGGQLTVDHPIIRNLAFLKLRKVAMSTLPQWDEDMGLPIGPRSGTQDVPSGLSISYGASQASGSRTQPFGGGSQHVVAHTSLDYLLLMGPH
eukprot:gene26527-4045_t